MSHNKRTHAMTVTIHVWDDARSQLHYQTSLPQSLPQILIISYARGW